MSTKIPRVKQLVAVMLIVFSAGVLAASDLDTTFNSGAGANNTVFTTAMQMDGKIIIGGSFTSINGIAKNYLARLNADGSLDASFNAGTGPNNVVYTTAVQADGKIIIAGSFTNINGSAKNYLARLNEDGSLDSSFNTGTGPNSTVWTSAIQRDGKIIIGGGFGIVNGSSSKFIARLNADGSLDGNFRNITYYNFPEPVRADSNVYTTTVQTDGKIIIGGQFTAINGTARKYIARLNSDGILDTSFNPGTGANNTVWSSAVQADGKIIIGGSFTNINTSARNSIVRLNTNGSVDTTFNTVVDVNVFVDTLAVQADGKVVIGGNFTNVNGTPINRIARLNADGSLDNTFTLGVGVNDVVRSVTVQADGGVVISGDFVSVNGTTINRIARVEDNDPDGDGLLNSVDPDDDNDGILDGVDNCPINSNVNQLDSDGDGIGNVCDRDNDNDGVADVQDAFPLNPAEWFDTDGDGVGNNIDNDDDNDGVTDMQDVFPLNAAESLDTDGDSIGNNADTDDDNDGVLDVNDNCPLVRNPNQNDSDADGVGDVCDETPFLTKGSLDSSFNPGSGANDLVLTSAVQADGKILIGGYFTTVDGVARNRIARLNADGSVDGGFNPGTGANSYVETIAVQADGKILIGGYFSTVNGVTRNSIARLNANGSVDSSFNPGTGGYVETIAVQADGKILIGGYFTTVNGVARESIARLNVNGSLDSSFSPISGADGGVFTCAVQVDGKIVIGGHFTEVNYLARNYIARLKADGSNDTFNLGSGADYTVTAIALQADGKMIFGGRFNAVNGTARNYIVRLNIDGSLDSSFNPGSGANNWVNAIAVQADGKIIIGGSFTTVNGTVRNRIARLNINGSLDSSFIDTAVSSYVNTITVEADGKIIIGGAFTSVNGAARNFIARIHSGDSDNDGIEDAADKFPNDTDNDGLTNDVDSDDDNDGMPDAWEIQYGLNPLVNDANGDLDGDGISNFQEYLNGTNPTVFNSAVSHNIKNDFSKDSASDVLWYDNASGNINIWNMLNGALANWNFIGYWPDTNNIPTLTGDINNDGNTDILWYNNTTGDVDAWMMQAGAKTDWTFLGYWPDTNVKPVLVGDFDDDGDDDILWYNNATGDVDIWVMQDGARVDWLYVGYWPDANFKPVLVGDFDGDGDDDILWWNSVTGDVDIWVMQNNTRSNWLYVGYWADTNNKPIGAGDFNNNGTDDILWYNSSTGDVNLWTIQAGARSNWTYIGTWNDTNNHIEEIGDFNGDGTADILWRNITTGSVTTWPMLNGVKQTGQYIGNFPGNNVIKSGL